MLCDWAEKVSLLVDGELSRAEAVAVEAHLGGCSDCRAARGEFLAFRRQLGSYRADVDPAAQRRALEAILASRPGPAHRDAAESAGTPRPGWRERLLAALGVSPFKPAAAAALALVAAAAVGLALYLNARDESRNVAQSSERPNGITQTAASPEASGPAGASASPAPPRDERDGQRRPAAERAGADAPGERLTESAGHEPRRKGRRTRGLASHSSRTGAAGAGPSGEAARTAPPVVANGETAPAPAGRRAPARAGLDTARHVEQAQMLLRSFRNARPSDDLAYERARSRRLLYRNIVLRREAASKGDPLVASVLGRLEPILIDIANLPDSPAPGDVDPIRERVRRKNLVVALQAGAGNTQVDSRQ